MPRPAAPIPRTSEQEQTVRTPPFALSSLTLSLFLAAAPMARAADAGEWQCTAGPDGAWVCSGGGAAPAGTPPLPAAPAAEPAVPAQPAVEPAPPVQPVAETPAPVPLPSAPAEAAAPVSPASEAPTPAAAPVAAQPVRPAPPAALAANPPVPAGACPSAFPPAEPGTEGDPADTRVLADAPRLSTDPDGNTVMEGGVDVRQGARRITARRALLQKATDEIDAQGEVRYRDPRIAVQGERLKGNLGNDSAQIEAARYQLAERNARGEASTLALTTDDHVILNGTRFTTCPEGRDDWSFSADALDINRTEGWAEAEDMVLRVGDVPVFYAPYFTFPVDDRRRSGFLFPSFGSSDRTGFDATVPYYLNLAENYDATLRPRYMSERGLMLGGEFRYLSEGSQGQVAAEFLPDDRGEILDDAQGVALSDSRDRYAYSVQHLTRFGQGWSAALDLNDISDDQYFRDLGTGLELASREQLTRDGRVNWGDRNWQIGLMASDTRVLNIVDQPYEIMPRLSALGNYPNALGGLNVNVYAEATEFDHESFVTGTRVHIQPGVSYPMEWQAGYVRPSLKYWHTEYEQDLERAPVGTVLEDSVSRDVPVASLDTGLVFERERDGGGVQTLEPRLFYLYVPEEEQDGIVVFDGAVLDSSFPQLFAENRFTGLDRIGDANQFTAAVTNRWLGRDGSEQASLSLGQIFYQADREVQLSPGLPTDTRSKSGLITELSWRFLAHWQAKGNLEWDEDESLTQKAQGGVYYADSGYAFNLRHRFRRPDPYVSPVTDNVEQADMSFALPLGADWRLVGSYNRDLVGDQDLEVLGGVEYSSCCWAVRVLSRRYLDVPLDSFGNPVFSGNDEYNAGVYVQFIFRGLAGVGNNNAGALLERSIPGYRDTLSQ